eukprot:TRINITY_DN3577_c0_g1_i3.p1 TRINITY_DN3577_c0_g1~~TRINITY_DN3577_c0_g1_i3.p1  ORF type:complete len:339 (-),score=13.66 TRINITY_DN3577_c0_g1_i3:21-1037(-)
MSNWEYIPTRHRVIKSFGAEDRISFPYLYRIAPHVQLLHHHTNVQSCPMSDLKAVYIKPNSYLMNVHSSVRTALSKKLCVSFISGRINTFPNVNCILLTGDVAFGQLGSHHHPSHVELIFICEDIPTNEAHIQGWSPFSDKIESLSLSDDYAFANIDYKGFNIKITYTTANHLISIHDKLDKCTRYTETVTDQSILSSIVHNNVVIYGLSTYKHLLHRLSVYPKNIVRLAKALVPTVPSKNDAIYQLYTHSFNDFFVHIVHPALSVLHQVIFALNSVYYPSTSQFQNIFSVELPRMKILPKNFIQNYYCIMDKIGSSSSSSIDLLYLLIQQVFNMSSC